MSANSLTISDSISESREVLCISLLSSPSRAKEAIRATIEATGCDADPPCGVPRVIMPATLSMRDTPLLDVLSDSSSAYAKMSE